MKKKTLKSEKILDILTQLYPQAGTELHFHSVYQLLVAVVLSAQCTDQRVNIVTEQLFARQIAEPFVRHGLCRR